MLKISDFPIWKFRDFLINVQNERVANIFDVVQRGLGMLPQQAKPTIFEKITGM